MSTDIAPALEMEEVACPLCGARDFDPVLKAADIHYGTPGEFQTVRCRTCRHVYVNPRPTLRAIGACYPADYGPHQTAPPPASAATNPARKARVPWYLTPTARRFPGLRRFYYWMADAKTDYVPEVETTTPRGLEVGCATGKFLTVLKARGWNAQGVELAENPAKLAIEQGHTVHIGTLETAAFSDEMFDAVFAWMVIEHLHEPRMTLQEIHRILKPGGWLSFSVPNFACWERKLFGKYWDALQLPIHLQHFTPRTVRQMLEATDFELVEIIHQRNLLNVVASIGNWLRFASPRGRIGPRLRAFTHNPTMWPQLALAPLAKFLALIRQGGRLTVVARKKSRTAAP